MDTKLKGVWEKVKAFFKNMSTKVRIILGASLAVVLIAIIALVLVLNNRPYATLFTNLTTAEASEIISYLQENGVTDYRLVGDTIEVRADQQQQARRQDYGSGIHRAGQRSCPRLVAATDQVEPLRPHRILQGPAGLAFFIHSAAPPLPAAPV